jgi:cyclic pyranopterin phosphate synthase
MIDSFGRRIDYLRLSVTDRCNLRCVYCLPESYSAFAAAEDAMSAQEITGLVARFAALGVSKIRVTGGEPLVRRDLVELIAGISGVRGVSDVALSTNGVLLEKLAPRLAAAGLRRVNVSLDSLKPGRFSEITRFGRLRDVLAGIDAALACGLSPVKLNVVAARGVNDGEIADFVRLTESAPLHVRFIELMPMGETGFFTADRLMPIAEVMSRAGVLEPVPAEDKPTGHGPARCFRRPGAQGTVGFIGALSCGFCEGCNRMRLSAGGVLLPCLDGSDGTDLKAALRRGAGPGEIERLIREAVRRKPPRHAMAQRAGESAAGPRYMCQVGG